MRSLFGVRGSLAQAIQGKKSSRKRKAEEADNAEESGSASKRTAREMEIDKTTQELREIQGLEKWILPQYRLWACMKVNGQHDNLDGPHRFLCLLMWSKHLADMETL